MSTAGNPTRSARHEAAQTAPTAGGSARRADIQGLRAIAVLAVVIYHVRKLLPAGFVGVDIFFVISGFVITGLLLREHERSGRISLKQFYLRRARRLMPSLALCTVVTVIASLLFMSPLHGWDGVGPGAIAATLASANLYFLASADGYFNDGQTNPFLHTWSLGVEEQFYLAFPLAAILCLGAAKARAHRRGPENGPQRLLWLTVLASVITFAMCVVLTSGQIGRFSGFGVRAAFFSPVTRIWEFGIGAILSILLVTHRARLDRLVQRTGPLLSIGGLVALLVSCVVVSDVGFPSWSSLVPTLATGALLLGGIRPGVVQSALSWRPLVWIGDRSYTWYLWHWPAIILTQTWWPASLRAESVAAVVSLVIAAIVYRYVENPIHLSQRWRPAGTTLRLVAACLLVPLLAGTTFLVGQRNAFGNQDIQALQTRLGELSAYRTRSCDAGGALGPGNTACTWTVPDAKGTVLLIGDSHAGQYSDAVIGAANELGYDAQVVIFRACTFALDWPAPNAVCSTFLNDAVAYLKAHGAEYAAVVVSSATVNQVKTTTGDGDASLNRWLTSSAATLHQFQPGTKTVVIADNPQFPGIPTCLRPSLIPFGAGGPGCISQSADAPEVAKRDTIVAAEKAKLTGIGVRYFDTRELVCGAGPGCAIEDASGDPKYYDVSHLTTAASKAMVPAFTDELRTVLAAR